MLMNRFISKKVALVVAGLVALTSTATIVSEEVARHAVLAVKRSVIGELAHVAPRTFAALWG
jgi:hypothetical protein